MDNLKTFFLISIFFLIIALLQKKYCFSNKTRNLFLLISLVPLFLIGGLIFYLRLSKTMALGMALVSLAILLLVDLVNQNFENSHAWIYLITFVVAWIGQFIGHMIEGAKPSFFDDLKFLLIGPGWLLSFIFQKMGIRY